MLGRTAALSAARRTSQELCPRSVRPNGAIAQHRDTLTGTRAMGRYLTVLGYGAGERSPGVTV